MSALPFRPLMYRRNESWFRQFARFKPISRGNESKSFISPLPTTVKAGVNINAFGHKPFLARDSHHVVGFNVFASAFALHVLRTPFMYINQSSNGVAPLPCNSSSHETMKSQYSAQK